MESGNWRGKQNKSRCYSTFWLSPLKWPILLYRIKGHTSPGVTEIGQVLSVLYCPLHISYKSTVGKEWM